MSAHWKDTGIVMWMLSICVSCATSGNAQACALNGLQFVLLSLLVAVFDMMGLYMVCSK